MPAVEARGWGWRYPGRHAWAVRGLELRIEHGERVLLLGASGSGKSTLLAGLAGVLDASSGGESEGELLVDGRTPDRARGDSGLLFQDPEDQVVLERAGDDVAFGLENRCVPRAEIWPRVDAALDAVRFPYQRDRSTAALSGGEMQRLALAGVIAARPHVLLLDEPTSSLDHDAARRLRDVLPALLDDATTCLVVEHHVGEWLPIVDRVVVLAAGGGVLVDGDPDTIFQDHRSLLDRSGVWVPAQPRRPSGVVRGVDRPRAGEEPLVVAERVVFRYPGADAPALAGVDAEIRGGEILAIMGTNGSGKSTLALLLAGLLRPDAGRVVATPALDADAPTTEIARWPASRLVRRIGPVLQNPEHQFLCARVDDEIALGARRAGFDESRVRATLNRLLPAFGLVSLGAANPFTLSGGEQRRVSIAAALAAEPAVLVLDEPTFGLDRRAHADLVALLGSLRDAGAGICLATHDEALVAALADRCLVLDAGEALA